MMTVMRCVRWLVVAAALASAIPSARAQTLAPSFEDSIAIGNLDTPVALAFAPTGEVFVAEKAGLVKEFAPLPSPGAGTVVLDLRAQVASYHDRGLLGLALHPAFPVMPYIYVLYTYDAPIGAAVPFWNDSCGGPGQPHPTNPGGGCVASGRLARYTLVGGALVDETILISDAWYQQYGSHSVGDLAFGPDGMLYVSAGEGASFQSYDNGSATWVNPVYPNVDDALDQGGAFRSLDLLTPGDPVGLSGTVLRLDPMTGDAAPGNPMTGGAARIIAFGLRNPFRMAFQEGSGELWVGDVGFGAYEELDRIRDVDDGVVEDFGWPCTEGTRKSPPYLSLPLCQNLIAGTLPAGTPGTLTYPYAGYYHGEAPGFDAATDPCRDGEGNAIVGLQFYAGAAYPERLHGALFFADYAVGCIYAMPLDAGGAPDRSRLEVIGRGLPTPVAMASAPDGDLYYTSLAGAVHHLRYVGHAPTAIATASATTGTAPLAVTFDGTQSIDPDAQPLTYAWDLDDDGAFDDATGATATWTYASGVHHARLRVTDTDGDDNVSAPIELTVDAGPPVATIDAPTSALGWRGGDIITFSGGATDPESGPLPASALHWQITLLHCPGGGCHPHPLQSFDGIASGSFVAVPDGYPAKYQITLTATDDTQLAGSSSVTIESRPTRLTFDTVPTNLVALKVGGQYVTSPFTLEAVPGETLEVEADSSVPMLEASLIVDGWSDGGAGLQRTLVVPDADTTLTVTYRCATCDDRDTGGCSAGGGGAACGTALILLALISVCRRLLPRARARALH